MLLVSKSGGKVIKSDMTFTKNFLITVRIIPYLSFYQYLSLNLFPHNLQLSLSVQGVGDRGSGQLEGNCYLHQGLKHESAAWIF